MAENQWKKPKDIEGKLHWKNGWSWREVYFQVSTNTIYLYPKNRKDGNQVLNTISITQVDEVIEIGARFPKRCFQIVLKTGVVEQFKCPTMDVQNGLDVQWWVDNLRHAMNFWTDKENLRLQKKSCQRRVTLEEPDETAQCVNVRKHPVFFTLWNGEMIGLLVNATSSFTDVYRRLFSLNCEASSCSVCKIRHQSCDLWAVDTTGTARRAGKNEILTNLDKAGNSLFVMEHHQKLLVVHFRDFSYEILPAPAAITAKEVLKLDQIASKLNELGCLDPGLFLREKNGSAEAQFCMNDHPFKYQVDGKMIVARSKRIRKNSLKKSDYEKIAELRWNEYKGFVQRQRTSIAIGESHADQIQKSCKIDEELCFVDDHFALNNDSTGRSAVPRGMQARYKQDERYRLSISDQCNTGSGGNDGHCSTRDGINTASVPGCSEAFVQRQLSLDNEWVSVVHHSPGNDCANNNTDATKATMSANDVTSVKPPDENQNEKDYDVVRRESLDKINCSKNNDVRSVDQDVTIVCTRNKITDETIVSSDVEDDVTGNGTPDHVVTCAARDCLAHHDDVTVVTSESICIENNNNTDVRHKANVICAPNSDDVTNIEYSDRNKNYNDVSNTTNDIWARTRSDVINMVDNTNCPSLDDENNSFTDAKADIKDVPCPSGCSSTKADIKDVPCPSDFTSSPNADIKDLPCPSDVTSSPKADIKDLPCPSDFTSSPNADIKDVPCPSDVTSSPKADIKDLPCSSDITSSPKADIKDLPCSSDITSSPNADIKDVPCPSDSTSSPKADIKDVPCPSDFTSSPKADIKDVPCPSDFTSSPKADIKDVPCPSGCSSTKADIKDVPCPSDFTSSPNADIKDLPCPSDVTSSPKADIKDVPCPSDFTSSPNADIKDLPCPSDFTSSPNADIKDVPCPSDSTSSPKADIKDVPCPSDFTSSPNADIKDLPCPSDFTSSPKADIKDLPCSSDITSSPNADIKDVPCPSDVTSSPEADIKDLPCSSDFTSSPKAHIKDVPCPSDFTSSPKTHITDLPCPSDITSSPKAHIKDVPCPSDITNSPKADIKDVPCPSGCSSTKVDIKDLPCPSDITNSPKADIKDVPCPSGCSSTKVDIKDLPCPSDITSSPNADIKDLPCPSDVTSSPKAHIKDLPCPSDITSSPNADIKDLPCPSDVTSSPKAHIKNLPCPSGCSSAKLFIPSEKRISRMHSDGSVFQTQRRLSHSSGNRLGMRRTLSDLNVRYSFTTVKTRNMRSESEPDLLGRDDDDDDDVLKVSDVFLPKESSDESDHSEDDVWSRDKVPAFTGHTWMFAKRVEDCVRKILDVQKDSWAVERMIAEHLSKILFEFLNHGFKKNFLGISFFSKASNVWDICQNVCKVTNVGVREMERIREGNIEEKFHRFTHECIRNKILSQWFEVLSSENAQKRIMKFYEPSAVVLEPEHSKAMEHLKIYLDKLSVLKLNALKPRESRQNHDFLYSFE